MTRLILERVQVRHGRSTLVDEVSATVGEDHGPGAGELFGLIGPNGAGKSSLLRAIAQLLPYQGTIKVVARDRPVAGVLQPLAELCCLDQLCNACTSWVEPEHPVAYSGRRDER